MFTTIQLNNNDEYYTPKSASQNIAHATRSFGSALLNTFVSLVFNA